MLGSLFKRQAPAAPEAAQPHTLYLEDSPGLRTILPPLEGTYAALVNSAHGVVIINRNDAGVGWQLITRGAYDAEQMKILEKLAHACAPGALILDIGANIGITTLTL